MNSIRGVGDPDGGEEEIAETAMKSGAERRSPKTLRVRGRGAAKPLWSAVLGTALQGNGPALQGKRARPCISPFARRTEPFDSVRAFSVLSAFSAVRFSCPYDAANHRISATLADARGAVCGVRRGRRGRG